MENNILFCKLSFYFLLSLFGFLHFLLVILKGKIVLDGKDERYLTKIMVKADLTFGILSILLISFCYFLKGWMDLFVVLLALLYLVSVIASRLRVTLGISKPPQRYRVLYSLISSAYIIISAEATSEIMNICGLPFSYFLAPTIYLGAFKL